MFGDINRIAKTMTSWFVPWFTCCVPDSSVFIKTTACVTMEHDPVRALSKQLKVAVRTHIGDVGRRATQRSRYLWSRLIRIDLIVDSETNHWSFLHQDWWADGRTWRGRNRCLRVHGPRMSLQDCSAGFRNYEGSHFSLIKLFAFQHVILRFAQKYSPCDWRGLCDDTARWLIKNVNLLHIVVFLIAFVFYWPSFHHENIATRSLKSEKSRTDHRIPFQKVSHEELIFFTKKNHWSVRPAQWVFSVDVTSWETQITPMGFLDIAVRVVKPRWNQNESWRDWSSPDSHPLSYSAWKRNVTLSTLMKFRTIMFNSLMTVERICRGLQLRNRTK